MLHSITKLGVTLISALMASSAFALNLPREIEPNDTPASARLINMDDGSIRGQLSSSSDRDFYKFVLAADGIVRFLIGIDSDCLLAGPANSNVYASVEDAFGQVVSTGRVITGCASGTMTILDANLVVGTYYLRLNAFDPTVAPTSDDYVITPLTKTSALASVVRENEPNNTPGSANVLPLNGGEVRGQLAGTFDIDYYIFQSPGGIVRFILGLDMDCAGDVTPKAPSNVRASIRAADGTLISIKDIVACTSGTTRAAVTTIEANTQPGNYYLLFQPNGDPTQKDYVIYPFGLFDPKQNKCTLDLDGNGTVDALTDGIMMMRALFGLTGSAVTNQAVGAGATRTTWTDIRIYLNSQCGFNFP